MEEQESLYQIIITEPAYEAFFEIAEYLNDHYSDSRAAEITGQLFEMVSTLNKHPERGTVELRFKHRPHDYRFILFNRHRRADIKIIYFIDSEECKVFITDFFPTEKDDKKISE
jgi:mRNA-degrading endonuclease RelE of RelBE toxin-antitoxin system